MKKKPEALATPPADVRSCSWKNLPFYHHHNNILNNLNYMKYYGLNSGRFSGLKEKILRPLKLTCLLMLAALLLLTALALRFPHGPQLLRAQAPELTLPSGC